MSGEFEYQAQVMVYRYYVVSGDTETIADIKSSREESVNAALTELVELINTIRGIVGVKDDDAGE